MNSKIPDVSAYVETMLALLAGLCAAHFDEAYMRWPKDGFHNRSRWMSTIKDETKLSEMALPGTHDSATFHINSNLLKGLTATQTLSFEEQMRYGIRVFDIRVRHINDVFVLHHDIVYLEIHFGDFLDSVETFLLFNPTETVLFRLKEELEPQNNTKTLGETLVGYMNRFPQMIYTTNDISITLGTVRGKAVILSDNYEFHRFGLRYSSFYIQDNYTLSSLINLGYKWLNIEEHLNKTIRGDPNKFYVNYLSASNPSRPFFAASGHVTAGTFSSRQPTGLTDPPLTGIFPFFPRIGCFVGICPIFFEGMNMLTRDRLREYNADLYIQDRAVGIIMADFPGDDLIRHIARNNDRLTKRYSTLWDI